MSILTTTSNRGDVAPTGIPTGSYVVDPDHTRVGFVARHAMVTKVRGSFNEFTGTGYFDGDDPAASHLELTIQAASIDTRQPDRDEHLRSSDFLAIDRYPTLDFRSTSIDRIDDGTYRVIGDLTLRGVTREVAVDFEFTGLVEDPDAGQRIGFEGTSVINRKDWGVNWNSSLDAGGLLVSDKITLEFDVSAVRQV